MLIITNLHKQLGRKEVLTGVNLSVGMGECLALVGPSGCGKTTLLRLIAGLDDANSGSIRIAGKTVSDPHAIIPPNKRGVGMVFQDLALWPHMTALANVEFMIPCSVKGRKNRQRRAAEVLDWVHLPMHNGSYPHQLSGGEQQRLALARTLASESRLLLLDEPFSSLDLDLKESLLKLVREIHATHSVTIIYVTHAAEEVIGLGQRIARMKDGCITEVISNDKFTTGNSQ